MTTKYVTPLNVGTVIAGNNGPWVLVEPIDDTVDMYLWVDESGFDAQDRFREDLGERVIGHVADMLAEGLAALCRVPLGATDINGNDVYPGDWIQDIGNDFVMRAYAVFGTNFFSLWGECVIATEDARPISPLLAHGVRVAPCDRAAFDACRTAWLGGNAVEPRRGHPEIASGEVFASLDWI